MPDEMKQQAMRCPVGHDFDASAWTEKKRIRTRLVHCLLREYARFRGHDFSPANGSLPLRRGIESKGLPED